MTTPEGVNVRSAISSFHESVLDCAYRGLGRTREPDFVEETVSDGAKAIYTDSAKAWGDLSDEDTEHQKVNHVGDEWVRGVVHTNTVEGVWSLLKRSVIGTYHQMSAKHLPAYLDEIAFRFNNRDNEFLFRDTLLRMIHGETLPYAELVADEDAA